MPDQGAHCIVNAARHKLAGPLAAAFNITADSAEQGFPQHSLPLDEGHPETSSALEGLGMFDPVAHGGLLVRWELLTTACVCRDHPAARQYHHMRPWAV